MSLVSFYSSAILLLGDTRMPNEFSSLLDIVLSKGIKHSEILGKIHGRILNEYKKKYPKAPISTNVILEENTGEIHLVSETKDITPTEFKTEAESLARQVLIDYMKADIPQPSVPPAINIPHYPISAFFFWIYNILFAIYNVFLGLSILPFIFIVVTDPSTRSALTQLQFTNILAAFLLLLTPYVSLLFVIRRKLYKTPALLGKILFLGELPFIILSVPLLFMQSLPLSIGFFWLCCLSLPFVLVTAEQKKAESPWGLFVRTVGFIVIVYLSMLFLFVLPLFVGEIFKAAVLALQSVFTPHYSSYNYGIAPYSVSSVFSIESAITLLLSILGFIGGILLIIAPFTLPVALGILVYRSFHTVKINRGGKKTVMYIGIPFGIFAILFISTFLPFSRTSLLSTLSTFDESNSFQEKMDKAARLSGKEKDIEGELARWKLISRQYPLKSGDTWLSRAYKNTLLLPDYVSNGLETLFYSLASPFVYHENSISEQKIYANYLAVYGVSFGTTPSSTAQNTKNVSIVSRKITAETKPTSLFATVTFEEEYRNQIFQEQEVVYEFSLPPDATVTDLDLGPDLEFQGQIAPRGAARRTYEQQLVRRRDPALIEQVGPRQYRLRVYPIPSKTDTSTLSGRNQKIRFTYTTPITWDGIPLPKFSKKQNMTELNLKQIAELNGQDVTIDQEKSVIPDITQRTAYCNGQISFPSFQIQGSAYILEPDNKSEICTGQAALVTESSDQNIAIVVDISAGNSQSLTDTLKKLFHDNAIFFRGGTIDLYYANSNGISDLIKVKEDGSFQPPTSFFGQSPTLTDLQKITKIYNAVFLLTGGTQPIHSDATDERGVLLNRPVFIYHVYGQIPTYPDDVTSSLLQSGGMVVDSLADAFFRTPIRRKSLDLMRNGWFVLHGSPLNPKKIDSNTSQDSTNSSPAIVLPEKKSSVTPEEALAAKYSVYAAVQRYPGGDIWSDTPQLDTFNRIATNSRIVTPFSSSLALVTTLQEQQLEQQNQQYNRYLSTTPAPTPFRTAIGITNPVIGNINVPTTQYGSITGSGLGPFSGVTNLSSPSFMMGNPMSTNQMSFSPASSFSGFFSMSGLLRLFILTNIVIFIIGILIFIPRFFVHQRKK